MVSDDYRLNTIKLVITLLFMGSWLFGNSAFGASNENSSVILDTPTFDSAFEHGSSGNLTTGDVSAGSVPGNRSAGLMGIAKNPDTYVKDEVIVRYDYQKLSNKKDIVTYSSRTNTHVGAVVKKDFSNDGLPGMQVVKVPQSKSVSEVISEYEKDPSVLYAEPNYYTHNAPVISQKAESDPVRLDASSPSDPDFGLQWGLHNTGQSVGGYAGTSDADIDAPEAWDYSTGSNTVIVAVIDSGVDYNHPDLAANIWSNTDEISANGIDDDHNGFIDDIRGWNFYSGNNDPMDQNTFFDTYHGTHCAGIIGAMGNNGAGISGVNWNVKIMPIRFSDADGSGTYSDAIQAITYANANGAHVISNSWGGSSYSQALKDAIDASPAVVVCAAGNEGNNTDQTPQYPSGYSSSNIISVAATDTNDNLASFSNYGPASVDLGAPGVYIWSTKKSSGYQYLEGTSMAAPFVSGVAALIKARNSSYTSAQIKSAILDHVDKKPSLSGKVVTGGRLNAYSAVQSVIVNSNLVIASITPSYGANTGSVNITSLAGNNFMSGATILLTRSGIANITATGVSVVSATRITCTLPLSGATAGKYDIVVTNPDGKQGVLLGGFTVTSSNDIPVVGNWDGVLLSDTGIFQPSNGNWYLDYNRDGITDTTIKFGTTGDIPITGDWNGDGISEIGVFRPSARQFILNTNPITRITYGMSTDTPLTGDWNGDGISEIGVFRPSARQFILNTNPITRITYGMSTDTPLTGDWNGDGISEIGVFRPSARQFILNTNPITRITYGMSTDTPLTGDWNGDDISDIGVYRSSARQFILNTNPITRIIID